MSEMPLSNNITRLKSWAGKRLYGSTYFGSLKPLAKMTITMIAVTIHVISNRLSGPMNINPRSACGMIVGGLRMLKAMLNELKYCSPKG